MLSERNILLHKNLFSFCQSIFKRSKRADHELREGNFIDEKTGSGVACHNILSGIKMWVIMFRNVRLIF